MSPDASTGATRRRQALVAAAGIAALSGACYPLAQIARADLPPFALAGSRLLLAGGLLAMVTVVTGRAWPRPRRGALLAGAVGPMIALSFASMFVAAPRVDAGLATVIENTQPLIAAVLAVPLLGERLDRRRTLGLGLGFAGVVLIAVGAGGSGRADRLGLVVVLLASFSMAGANVLQRRLAPRVDPIAGASLALLAGGLGLAGLSWRVEGVSWGVVSNTVWLVVALLAIFGTALTQAGWLWVLRRLTLAEAGAVLLLGPAVALFVGVRWFDERVTSLSAAGVVLVLAGSLVASLGGRSAVTSPSGPRTPGRAP